MLHSRRITTTSKEWWRTNNTPQTVLLNGLDILLSLVLVVRAWLHSLHLQKCLAAPQRTLAVYSVSGCSPRTVTRFEPAMELLCCKTQRHSRLSSEQHPQQGVLWENSSSSRPSKGQLGFTWERQSWNNYQKKQVDHNSERSKKRAGSHLCVIV